MSEATTYKLDELARAAGTSVRTVRYYVQRGLLPAPAFRGKDTAYAHEHLVRLRAIRRLQAAHLPLDEIAVELERRSLRELERLADTGEGLVAPTPAEVPATRRASGGRPAADKARVVHRFEIAPGVTVELDEQAPRAARALVEKILELAGRT